jgi:hypothetical protein
MRDADVLPLPLLRVHNFVICSFGSGTHFLPLRVGLLLLLSGCCCCHCHVPSFN